MTLNIPKLRFKGFEEDWKLKKLNELSNISRGRFSPRPRNNPKYYGGNIPFVQTGDVVKSNGKIRLYTQTLNNEGLKVSKLFPKGTILITIAANIGYTGILDIDMACPDSLIGIECNDTTNNLFLNYYLSTQQTKMDRVASEAAQKNINIEFLKPYKVYLPQLSEQQKIASFLSKVDEWIENLKEQKENLGKYKKGMMQKIFAQEIRFKDENGKKFPEWEEKRLGEIGNIYNGLTGKSAEDFGVGKAFITYKQIFDSSFININRFSFVKISSSENQNKGQFGDIFFTTSSETPEEVGFASVLLEKNIFPYLNSFSFGFRPNSLLKLDPYFAKFFFRHSIYRREVIKLAQGSTRYNISKSGFIKIKIKLPLLEEQQKISDFLESIDKLLESKQKQIAKAEKWKKGLMQGLFV